MNARFAILLAVAIAQAGCAAIPATLIAGGAADRAAHSVAGAPGSISIEHSRYQFFPDAAAMDAECRSMLAQKAGAHDPAAVRITHTRNILTGVSSCSASVTPAS